MVTKSGEESEIGPSKLRLGDRISRSAPDQAHFVRLVEWKTEEADPKAVAVADLDVRVVNSYSERLEVTGVSAALNYLGAVKASVAQSRRVASDRRTVSFVASAVRRFHGERITDMWLNERGLALLKRAKEEKNEAGFVRVLGTHVVTYRAPVARILIEYRFTCSSEETRIALQGHLSMNYRAMAGTLDLSALKRSFDSQLTWSIHVTQVGAGGGADAATQALAARGDLDGLATAVEVALKAVNRNQVEYALVSFGALRELPEIAIEPALSTAFEVPDGWAEPQLRLIANAEGSCAGWLDAVRFVAGRPEEVRSPEAVQSEILRLQRIQEKLREMRRQVLLDPNTVVEQNALIVAAPAAREWLKRAPAVFRGWAHNPLGYGTSFNRPGGNDGQWMVFYTYIWPEFDLVCAPLIDRMVFRVRRGPAAEASLVAVVEGEDLDGVQSMGASWWNNRWIASVSTDARANDGHDEKSALTLAQARSYHEGYLDSQAGLLYEVEVVLMDGSSETFALGNVRKPSK